MSWQTTWPIWQTSWTKLHSSHSWHPRPPTSGWRRPRWRVLPEARPAPCLLASHQPLPQQGPAAGEDRHSIAASPHLQAIVATDVHLPELLLHAAQDQVALAEAAAAAERAQQAQQVQQAQQGHLDLVSLLMEASQRPAAAAAGLTANLVDRFWAVMATLSLKEQAARVGGCYVRRTQQA